jgi:peroxin-1
LHEFVRNARIWTQTVSLQSPEKDVRAELLRAMVHNVMSRAARDDVCDDLDFVALTSHTDGYHVADLHMLTERALQEAAIRCLLESRRISLTMRDFERAREGYTPIALRGIKLEQSSTEWADIGGLAETRHVLRETLEWPTKYAAIFANCPLRLRSGLLLYGFPGCGKTLLASAVAKECGLNFISVKGPEVLQKYVGASEKSVRDLFERAQSAKPCVLFFDEFESVAPKRGQDSNGVTDRVVNQLLTQMDGAEGLDGVYVLAATSRPDLIDAALLRPGRLDKALLCDMPKWEDRLDILRVVARKVPIDSDVDLDVWARRTEGFSGADLQALLYNAQLDAIHATLHATSSAGNDASSDHNQKHASQLAYLSIAPTKEANDDSHVALSNADKAALSSRLERILRSSQDPDSRTATLASTSTSSSSASASSSHSNAATTTTSSSANDRPRQKYLVTNKFMESSFQQTRPSVPAAEVARLRRIYAQFTGERDGKGLDAANMDAIGSHTSLM